MNKEQIEQVIAEVDAIWGIEGMAPLTERERSVASEFLSGKITKEEFGKQYLAESEICID